MDCRTPGFPVLHHFQSLFKLMSIESRLPSSHPILCCPFLLLPSISPSIRVFSNESVVFASGGQSIGASASVFPKNIQGNLISFQIYRFGLLAVQGTLMSLLQHHRSKALVTQNVGWDWDVFQIGKERVCWPWISRAGITCHWINTND